MRRGFGNPGDSLSRITLVVFILDLPFIISVDTDNDDQQADGY
jgi:hypothetical protein